VPALDLICLANSYKLGHRCVAGLRTDGSAWIRLVTETEHGELQDRHYRLRDQSEPGVLDVIRVGLSNPHPLPHQPENWRIDGSTWELIERPAGGSAPVSWLVLFPRARSFLETTCGRQPPIAGA